MTGLTGTDSTKYPITPIGRLARWYARRRQPERIAAAVHKLPTIRTAAAVPEFGSHVTSDREIDTPATTIRAVLKLN